MATPLVSAVFPIPSSALDTDWGQTYSPHCNPPSQGNLRQHSLCSLYQWWWCQGFPWYCHGCCSLCGLVVVVTMVSLLLSWLLLLISYVLVNHFYCPNIPAPSRLIILLPHSQSQISAANCLFDTSLNAFRHYSQIREILQQQILTAIDPTYYNVLDCYDLARSLRLNICHFECRWFRI